MREHDLMQQARGALVAHGEALAAHRPNVLREAA